MELRKKHCKTLYWILKSIIWCLGYIKGMNQVVNNTKIVKNLIKSMGRKWYISAILAKAKNTIKPAIPGGTFKKYLYQAVNNT